MEGGAEGGGSVEDGRLLARWGSPREGGGRGGAMTPEEEMWRKLRSYAVSDGGGGWAMRMPQMMSTSGR